MKKLHPVQEKMLEILKKQQEYPLSIRELQEFLGVSSPSLVHHHILQLEKKGYIKRDPYNPRNYQILERNENEDTLLLNMYGLAQCGPDGIFLDGNLVERLPMSRKMIHFDITKAFLVRAKGDSMMPKINEGDIVIAEKSDNADSGQIVVCTYCQKALIKQFQMSGKFVLLKSLNSAFDPIIANPDDVMIVGIVRGVVNFNM